MTRSMSSPSTLIGQILCLELIITELIIMKEEYMNFKKIFKFSRIF